MLNQERWKEVDIEGRFWNRVTKLGNDSCWDWVGNKERDGYGRMKVQGKTILAHRLSYVIHVGKLEDGMVIHHRCNNKSCVNPAHLQQTTNRLNAVFAANDKRFTP